MDFHVTIPHLELIKKVNPFLDVIGAFAPYFNEVSFSGSQIKGYYSIPIINKSILAETFITVAGVQKARIRITTASGSSNRPFDVEQMDDFIFELEKYFNVVYISKSTIEL